MKRLLLSLALLLTIGAGCADAAAPTLISYTETVWNTSAASKASASISWQTNDVIVVLAGAEGAASNTLGVPTATGLTFTKQKGVNAGNLCATMISASVAGSTSSGAVTVTFGTVNTEHWGFGVWVYRGSAGIGNSAEQHTTTLTVPLTPTAADGAIVYGIFDFNTSTVGTIVPTPTNTRQRVADATHYTLYAADLADQVSAGAVSYGISGPGSTTGPFSIVALEVKAGAGGGGGCTDSHMLGVWRCDEAPR